jgi:hypothetical protein
MEAGHPSKKSARSSASFAQSESHHGRNVGKDNQAKPVPRPSQKVGGQPLKEGKQQSS